ncbi:MAG: Spo0B domain-containing protein [Tumebacillaceae bacterium]
MDRNAIRTLMEESLEVLRTYRHDLMNQVQLIQAYAQMKKYERLQTPIQALVAEAQRHTEWSSFPSAMVSYVVVSRDISYPMLTLHVSYEQKEAPLDEAEMLAAQVLSDMLDRLGAESKTVLEPIPLDVWIVANGQGYEIGWYISEREGASLPAIDWSAWAQRWEPLGVQFSQEQAEDGTENLACFQLSVERER